MNNKIKIGGHLSFTKPKYLLGLIEEAIKSNCNVAALFVGSPRSANITQISDEEIKAAHELAKKNNIDVENFVVHARYILNMAKEGESRQFVLRMMKEDINLTNRLGIKYFNFHPGNHLDHEAGIKICIDNINQLISKTKNVILLLETTTAKGTTIGGKFEEIASIINGVKDKTRIGVCIDTCHIWDAGFDIKNNFDKVLKNFDEIVGLNYLKAFHINDSKNVMGSQSDRHENIGQGNIGLEFFRSLVRNKKLKDLSFILETPWNGDKHSYKKEIEMITK